MSKREIKTVVWRLERLNNSVNGNPRYNVGTEEGQFTTSSDHSFCYGLENGWGHGVVSRPATLTLTRAGRVENLVYTDVV